MDPRRCARSKAGRASRHSSTICDPRAAAILAEYQAATDAELAESEEAFGRASPRLPLDDAASIHPRPDSAGPALAARKGLTATIGAMRPLGTSLIFEGRAFPLEHFAAGVTDLQSAPGRPRLPGRDRVRHAKDGNIHFISAMFNDDAAIEQIRRFTDDLVAMVVDRYDGASRRARRGRNMAPFVLREWGDEAVRDHARGKRLVDPDSILTRRLAERRPARSSRESEIAPRVEDESTAASNAAFANRMSESRLTVTPRQRIVNPTRAGPGARPAATGRAPAPGAGLGYAVLHTARRTGCARPPSRWGRYRALVKRLRARGCGAFSRALASRAAANVFDLGSSRGRR